MDRLDIPILRKKKALKRFLILAALIAVFYAFVCTTVSIWISSDTLLSGSVLSVIWGMLTDAVNFLFYWLAFAYLILFGFSYNRSIKQFFGIYAAVAVMRYVLCQVATFALLGFPSVNYFLVYTLPYILLDIGLDLAQVAVGAWIVVRFSKRTEAELTDHVPSERLFHKENPLLATALRVAIIPSAMRIASRLIFDIYVGLPKSLGDLLWMLTYYLFDVLSFLIGYIVILLILNRLSLREQRADVQAAPEPLEQEI